MDRRPRWLRAWTDWHQDGADAVLIGAMSHCIGCGRALGSASIALDGEPWPTDAIDWPYNEAACPVCRMRDELKLLQHRDRDRLAERAERLARAKKPADPAAGG